MSSKEDSNKPAADTAADSEVPKPEVTKPEVTKPEVPKPKAKGFVFKPKGAIGIKRAPEPPPTSGALKTEVYVVDPIPFKGNAKPAASKLPSLLKSAVSKPVSIKPVVIAPKLNQQLNPVPVIKPVQELTPLQELKLIQEIQEPPSGSLLPPVKLENYTDALQLNKKPEGLYMNQTIYYPEDRKGFTRFIYSTYEPFKLPEQLDKRINPNACAASDKKVEAYPYQQFIREYMRQASPYRGILVYHGLGSGKTCTSIAAAEALYGQTDKKVIVMTPISLKENFLNELMNCGFRHYRLKPNVWVPYPIDVPGDLTAEATLAIFAINVLGISEHYWERLKRQKDTSKRVLWIVDLTKPEGQSNFDTLSDIERTMIRDQVYDILQSKYTFIGYTSTPILTLLKYAKQGNAFDDSVIVIDEVHNLSRLMTGKLERFLVKKEVKRKSGKVIDYYEPITTEPWIPEFPEKKVDSKGKEVYEKSKYTRAYLLYRLLSQAKRSKIIALSGTPIVNQPTEIGILGNILHGYFQCVTFELNTIDDTRILNATNLLEQHPRVNFYKVSKKTNTTQVFCTILDEGYVKLFEGSTMQGVVYVGEDAIPATIHALYEELKEQCKKLNLTTTIPTYEAEPLFPPSVEHFTERFVDKENLKLKNKATFVKRFSGLISYYKGYKEELMPSVNEYPPVACPFGELALSSYSAARLKEIAEAPKTAKPSGFDEVSELVQGEVSSYRFHSRAACNFSFPTELKRPIPGKKHLKEELADSEALVTDRAVNYEDTSEEAVLELEKIEEIEQKEQEEEQETQEEEEDQKPSVPLSEKEKYKQEVQHALQVLHAKKGEFFSTKESLEKYSNKYSQILDRIRSARGSSLVYSQFKTFEGIGIFSMVLDANGFVPIRLKGPETDLELTEESEASLRNNPEQPRYIFYSGGEPIRVRQVLINIFNMRLDKLPTKIAKVFQDLPITATRNLYGQVCRGFLITGAGAEGLSLKNVSAVHIMEPYWNKVRTDQVKGRAVRICSHSELPYSEDPAKNERVVDVFTYISVFKDISKIDETLRGKDGGKTTDEHILELAGIKEEVSSDFLCHIKAAAVDCRLNKSENEKTINCLYQTQGTLQDFLYDPRVDEDLKSESHLKDKQIEFCKKTPDEPSALVPSVQIKQALLSKTYTIQGVKYKGIPQPNGEDFLYTLEDLTKQVGVVRIKDGKKVASLFPKNSTI